MLWLPLEQYVEEGRHMFIRKKKARTILWAITGTLVFASSAAITSAYFTSTDQTVRNILTPGTVRGELTETDWEEKNGEHLLPGESRKKNPAVRNAGTLASWMFLEVNIPIRRISLVDENTKRKQPEGETELFRFRINAGWELIEKTRTGNDMHYVYGWKEMVAPTKQTGTLFDSITMVPYLEGSLNDKEVYQIRVTAKAIQKNIAPTGTGMKDLYQIYLSNQK